ncbi:MAG: nucleotidyltransferase domain-containing protein [Bacteroidaceae bacterium]|mgnify:FL=1|nr:nucleotidyltransferase domain-containing protein [Bacteroidaceae bacterium]
MAKKNDILVLEGLQQVAKRIIPQGGQVWLYGSRARGEAREDSDWDLLILLDKERIEYEDFGKVGYPFEMMGWNYDAGITPVIYTKKEWEARAITPFYQNVQRDKIRIL